MNINKKSLCFLSLAIFLSLSIYAQDANKEEAINPTTGFPEITEKPFIVFNEGFSCNWTSRFIKQEERSNFVFDYFMLGAWFGISTFNMKPINSTVRISALYPLTFTFNEVPQAKKNMIQFAIDLFAGPEFRSDMWNYVRINFAPGLHFFFQNEDRWNYVSLGAGCLLGIELPLARRWTILLNGLAAIDYPNLGTNRIMEPYTLSWTYQLDLGVRYSKKATNTWNYIKQIGGN